MDLRSDGILNQNFHLAKIFEFELEFKIKSYKVF